MSGSYSSRLRAGASAGGRLGATTVLAAKVAFASAALAAAASLARAAVRQLVSGADAFLWKLYLFVTVHVIIFVIWKLSDTKHFHAPAHKDPWAPTPHHPVRPPRTEQVALSAVKRKVEFSVTRPHEAAIAARADEHRVLPPQSEAVASKVDEEVVSPGSCGGESCVTTESEEHAASSPAATPAYVDAADTRWCVAPAPLRECAVVKRGVSLPDPSHPFAALTVDEHLDGADHDDDLDATWNAIMQKTRPSTAPGSSPSAPAARSSSPPPQTETRQGARDWSRQSARRS